MPNQAAPFAQ